MSVHPSTVNRLPGVGLWRQQFQQGAPDFSFLGNINQLWTGNPEAFPGHYRDIISPLGPGSTPGPLHSWTYLGHHREVTRRHPQQMPKPPQLAPFNTKEQRLYCKSLMHDWTSHLILKGDTSNTPEETRSCPSYLQPHSSVMTHLTTTGKGKNKDWPVDRDLCPSAQVPLCHNSAVKGTQNCSCCTNSQANFSLHSHLILE